MGHGGRVVSVFNFYYNGSSSNPLKFTRFDVLKLLEKNENNLKRCLSIYLWPNCPYLDEARRQIQ